jgi:hypothetical protein
MLADEAIISKWQQPNTPRFKDYTADDVANSRTGSSVCLAGQGRAGQGGQTGGRAGSVCPSVLQGRAGGRAGGKAGRAGAK